MGFSFVSNGVGELLDMVENDEGRASCFLGDGWTRSLGDRQEQNPDPKDGYSVNKSAGTAEDDHHKLCSYILVATFSETSLYPTTLCLWGGLVEHEIAG